MKRAVSLLSALLVCLFCLAACGGGVDAQPAIDAHNRAGDAINALTEVINQNPDAYSQEDLADMQELIDQLNACGEYLEKGEDLTQDALDEWVEVCGDIEQWAIEAKAELES